MSFLFQGQAPSIYFDQDNQRTTKVRGIATVVASIAGFTPTTNTTVLKTVTVNGLNVPSNASNIPGDVVIAQPMAALGATNSTVMGAAYVSSANTVTIPFITVGTAAAIATQDYLITVIKLGQLDGLSS
jgi:hypothetical protein